MPLSKARSLWQLSRQPMLPQGFLRNTAIFALVSNHRSVWVQALTSEASEDSFQTVSPVFQ